MVAKEFGSWKVTTKYFDLLQVKAYILTFYNEVQASRLEFKGISWA